MVGMAVFAVTDVGDCLTLPTHYGGMNSNAVGTQCIPCLFSNKCV